MKSILDLGTTASLIAASSFLIIVRVALAKQGDNRFGSICLSVHPSMCVLSWLNGSTYDHDYQSMVFVCLSIIRCTQIKVWRLIRF